jgi:putative transposase
MAWLQPRFYASSMPRLPRFFVPGLPLHVILRGNNRAPIFRAPEDCLFYRACLSNASRRHGVAIHAYVLMTNHVHVLATPASPTSMPKTMQAVGQVYVRYFNAIHERTGTLFEGRYKAAIVDDDGYLLACMRYIELNPVRAGIVALPGDYRWSSYHVNAWGEDDPLVQPHALYRLLGREPGDRRATYRGLFADAIGDEAIARIRDATQHGWALGDARFRQNVTALNRRAERLAKGRRRSKALSAPKIESDPLLS